MRNPLYVLAFRLTFFFTSLKDRKLHKKNKRRETISVEKIDTGKARINICSDKSNEKKTFLFNVHGGGWMYGDEDLNLDFGKYFAENGYLTVIPSYPLAFKADLIEMLETLIDAMEEMERRNLVSQDKNVLIGDSAGAHLALLLVALENSKELREKMGIRKPPIKFSQIVIYHPCTYPEELVFVKSPKWMNKGVHKTFISMLCGKRKERIQPYFNLSSFIKYLPKDRKIAVLSSKGDTFLSYQTDMTLNDFKKEGIEAEYIYIDDEKFDHVHSVTAVDDTSSLEANKRVLDFLSKE